MNIAEEQRVLPGQPCFDFVLQRYRPERPSAGKLRSETLFLESARRHPALLEIHRRLKERLGQDRVVYGVKHRSGQVYWELYFYNQGASPDMRIDAVRELLAGVLRLEVAPPASLPPYFMFSVELDPSVLASGRVGAVSVYFSSRPRGSGFSMALRGAKVAPENKYVFFFKPRDPSQSESIIERLAPTLRGHPGELEAIRALTLQARTSVCVAYKARDGAQPRHANSVYFSGLSSEAWLDFLGKRGFPAPIQEFARIRGPELDYLWHDVGADFEEKGPALNWTKAGFYGVF